MSDTIIVDGLLRLEKKIDSLESKIGQIGIKLEQVASMSHNPLDCPRVAQLEKESERRNRLVFWIFGSFGTAFTIILIILKLTGSF